MNILYYSIILFIGLWLWRKSGVGFLNKQVALAVVGLVIVWGLIWGQIAIHDGWWFYNENNFLGLKLGAVPLADFLYFFAGIGWTLYFGKKLKLFD